MSKKLTTTDRIFYITILVFFTGITVAGISILLREYRAGHDGSIVEAVVLNEELRPRSSVRYQITSYDYTIKLLNNLSVTVNSSEYYNKGDKIHVRVLDNGLVVPDGSDVSNPVGGILTTLLGMIISAFSLITIVRGKRFSSK